MAHQSDEDRIRRKAHEIWESEGRPHGRDQDHWVQAREIVALQDSMGETLLPRDTGAEEPEEPSLAVGSQGDLPNLTDQGEHALTDIDREPEITKPVHAAPRPDAAAPAPVETAGAGIPRAGEEASRAKPAAAPKAKAANAPSAVSPPSSAEAMPGKAQSRGAKPATTAKNPRPGPIKR